MTFPRIFRIPLFIAAAILTLNLVTAGCGKKPTAPKEEAAKPAAEATKPEAAPAAPAAPAGGTGSIKGKVAFTGTAPTAPDLNRQADPFCAKTPMKDPEITVNGNGTLANVAVTIPGEVAGGSADTGKVEVDQTNCMYTPRVKTAKFDQPIAIVNSDPILHNIHTYADSKTLFNRAQPKGSPAIEKQFTKEDGGVIKFKCDVHPWMTGWLVLDESGYGAVTGETGEFEIQNVPAGTYTLQAWHEKYGPKTVQVTVEAGKPAEANFSYDGSEKVAYQYKEFDTSAIMGH